MKTSREKKITNPIGFFAQRGVSLVEFMIASTVGLILITGAASLMLSAQQGKVFRQDFDQMQENLRYGSNVIQRVFRQGTSFEAPDEEGEVKISLKQGTGSHDCMGVENSQSNVFYIDDGSLFCKPASSSAQALADNFDGKLFVEYGFDVDENGIIEYRAAKETENWSVPTSARITLTSHGQSVRFVATMRQKVIDDASIAPALP